MNAMKELTAAQANIMAEIVDEKIATKQDLRELELRLKYDPTLRMGAMMTVGVAFLPCGAHHVPR